MKHSTNAVAGLLRPDASHAEPRMALDARNVNDPGLLLTNFVCLTIWCISAIVPLHDIFKVKGGES